MGLVLSHPNPMLVREAKRVPIAGGYSGGTVRRQRFLLGCVDGLVGFIGSIIRRLMRSRLFFMCG